MLLPHDYLNFHLTGNYFMEFGDASGTALMDVRKRTWSSAVINALDKNLADWLPELSPSHAAAGTLRAEIAQKYGFSTDVVVSAGGGDNMMGAIGTGNVSPGVVSASLGTSGTVYAYCNQPVVDPRGEIAAFCSSTGGWLPLLCTMNVTMVTEQIRTLFGWDHGQLEQAVASAPVGSAGLALLPYLDGERTPNLPRATGVFSGLTRHTLTAPMMARAAMEGVTMNMNYGLRRLAALGVKAKEIRVTGGGSKSAGWRQMMADVFGVPVVAMVEDEGAALGGALQAAWCISLRDGKKAKLTDFTNGIVALNESTRCAPDKQRKAQYRELQEKRTRPSARRCGRRSALSRTTSGPRSSRQRPFARNRGTSRGAAESNSAFSTDVMVAATITLSSGALLPTISLHDRRIAFQNVANRHGARACVV